MKRLRIEAIDLYLLHFFDQLTPLADVAATMKKLQSIVMNIPVDTDMGEL